MLNPWVWLAVVLAMAGSGATGYSIGRRTAQADCLTEMRKADKALIDRTQKSITNENARQENIAKKDDESKRVIQAIKQEVKREIVDCNWSGAEFNGVREYVRNAQEYADRDSIAMPKEMRPNPADRQPKVLGGGTSAGLR